MAGMISAWAIEGVPEIAAGDDLARLIGDAIASVGTVGVGAAAGEGDVAEVSALVDGDIVVVTSKVVSKSEGRFVVAADREDAITDETVRVVATRTHPGGVTRIVENRLGIVAAAAGVDASNTPDGTVLLLPVDPDASARALCSAWRSRFGVRIGVIITDTLGRAWREGQTDVAIGAAGVSVVDDFRGSVDSSGRRLDVSVAAIADEVAGMTDLVKGKALGMPVAIVRGLDRFVVDAESPGARSLTRTGPTDMFRLGTDEALAEGYTAGFTAGLKAANPVAGPTANPAAGQAANPVAGPTAVGGVARPATSGSVGGPTAVGGVEGPPASRGSGSIGEGSVAGRIEVDEP